MNARFSLAFRWIAAAALVLALAALVLNRGLSQPAASRAPSASPPPPPPADASVELSSNQLASVQIEPVGTHSFPLEKEAIGSITFVDDLSVQVFPPYPGKLLKTFAELGDAVQLGQPLYTVHSPDFIQAQSTLISAAATFDLTSKELARARDLFQTKGVSEREMEQAASDQQAAEGALRAARDAVRTFGKTDAEVDQILATRTIDPALVVRSPIAGIVTAFNAPPGLFVQPGTAPAPLAVADPSVKWMVGNVIESDSPLLRESQPVRVRVMAFPDREFAGKISKIYATVDPNTRRVGIRSEVGDPKNELRPGMLAHFFIRIGEPADATALPASGVVREGDGTMTAWVTTDRHRFQQRVIKVGRRHDGWVQILDGLKPGELAVTDGAIFLDNMLQAPPSD